MALWSTFKAKMTMPLIGLGAVSVSTVLAACYGPDPGFVGPQEYCEDILQSCVKEDIDNLSVECRNYCNDLRQRKANGEDYEVPACCPEPETPETPETPEQPEENPGSTPDSD